jgi:hypothetical protein
MPSKKNVPTVFVHGLADGVTDEQLVTHFANVAPVKRAFVARDPRTRAPRNFGFVNFLLEDDVDVAVAKLNGSMLLGRRITVDRASVRSGAQGASAAPPAKHTAQPAADAGAGGGSSAAVAAPAAPPASDARSAAAAPTRAARKADPPAPAPAPAPAAAAAARSILRHSSKPPAEEAAAAPAAASAVPPVGRKRPRPEDAPAAAAPPAAKAAPAPHLAESVPAARPSRKGDSSAAPAASKTGKRAEAAPAAADHGSDDDDEAMEAGGEAGAAGAGGDKSPAAAPSKPLHGPGSAFGADYGQKQCRLALFGLPADFPAKRLWKRVRKATGAQRVEWPVVMPGSEGVVAAVVVFDHKVRHPQEGGGGGGTGRGGLR